jgi:hypothetical protein
LGTVGFGNISAGKDMRTTSQIASHHAANAKSGSMNYTEDYQSVLLRRT